MGRIRSVADVYGLRWISRRFSEVYISETGSLSYGPPVCEFVKADGRIIPVFESYRYQVKAGWRNFPGLNHLALLDTHSRLTNSESAFLSRAVGTRTVTVTSDEAMSVAQAAVQRSLDLFLPGSSADSSLPEFHPGIRQLCASVDLYKRRHAAMFERLRECGIYRVPQGGSVLEIGYTTGGHSIFAFEKLGFNAFGIDNYYGGLIAEQTHHGYNKLALGSNVIFEMGDISKSTQFPQESIDVVFSSSVLEHILDLKGAFVEMHRLLKPGGVMIHYYHPYFCHDGGHALGVGDSPWAHVRLSKVEYLRYLKELRPNEYEITSKWLDSALHRDMPQWKVQRLAVATGFRIGMWLTKPSPKKYLADLNHEIVEECFSVTPAIGLEDLVSQSVFFVGIKP